MTQLIIDNMVLPESLHGGYSITNESLHVDVEMIDGSIVREVRGDVWHIAYQYGYFNDADRFKFISICEKGMREPIVCNFLEQENDESLRQSTFIVTSFKRPHFVWRTEQAEGLPKAIWMDYQIELREVSPHA